MKVGLTATPSTMITIKWCLAEAPLAPPILTAVKRTARAQCPP